MSWVSIPQAVWIACNYDLLGWGSPFFRFNTASGMDCMQYLRAIMALRILWFQYRKRYGLHAIWCPQSGVRGYRVSIPQAVWIACNSGTQSQRRLISTFQYRKRYGLHAICSSTRVYRGCCCFNTASGMDCMQYCLPEALETVSPKTEFLTMTPFSRFFPKWAEHFCREKCFERGLKPVIARALLSTKEI